MLWLHVWLVTVSQFLLLAAGPHINHIRPAARIVIVWSTISPRYYPYNSIIEITYDEYHRNANVHILMEMPNDRNVT